MYMRLPRAMQAREVLVDNSHELRLSNGSSALAFPTTGGRSYTGTFALVDEAEYCTVGVLRRQGADALDALLDAIKPTIDGGGQLVLLSTVDKRRPGSAFKRIYEAAKAGGTNGYTPVFLPWFARPDRTPEWYEGVKRDFWARSGTYDSLYAEYPATDVEALAALSSDARFAAEWLKPADATTRLWREGTDRQEEPKTQRPEGRQVSLCTSGSSVLPVNVVLPSLPHLAVWELPQPGRCYVIGADPAEGNPQSDESAACLLDAVTGDQVAVWSGRFEPATFAHGLAAIAAWAAGHGGTCGVLVERNNHGHAVLLALRESGAEVLRGLDGQHGWLTTAKGKALAVDAAADLLRDGAAGGRAPRVRDPETLRQLLAFSGSPPGRAGGRSRRPVHGVVPCRRSRTVLRAGVRAGCRHPTHLADRHARDRGVVNRNGTQIELI